MPPYDHLDVLRSLSFFQANCSSSQVMLDFFYRTKKTIGIRGVRIFFLQTTFFFTLFHFLYDKKKKHTSKPAWCWFFETSLKRVSECQYYIKNYNFMKIRTLMEKKKSQKRFRLRRAYFFLDFLSLVLRPALALA